MGILEGKRIGYIFSGPGERVGCCYNFCNLMNNICDEKKRSKHAILTPS